MGFCPLMAEHVYENNQAGITNHGDPMQTRIKEYRGKYSLTQEDLAKAVGVRRETIVFLEQGKYNPSLKLAHDVARTLHATIDEVFIFEDDSLDSSPREILVD
jgi:putative transcriptional regulator